ncbi:MAG: nitrous oxide reductase accessory protein NosL [Rubellimicrobium sp.]|nr:nitrous oxide reductase accessory protein NosL [Rubellimicrobium sp.]
MIRPLPILIALALMAPLAACKEKRAVDLTPLELTVETVGYYCQMDLLEHPGPKAQVHLEGMPAPLFFSQVRDAIAFSRDPEQMAPILALYVNDMGREGATWDDPGEGNWISADEAWYVVGTAREGGMGTPETIPFASQEAARAMAAAEGGTVLRLAEIPDDMVLAPVEVPDAADESDFQARLRALSQQTQEAAP